LSSQYQRKNCVSKQFHYNNFSPLRKMNQKTGYSKKSSHAKLAQSPWTYLK